MRSTRIPTPIVSTWLVCALLVLLLASPLALAKPGNNGPPTCNDGIDNDGNGVTDYGADPGCASRHDDEGGNEPVTACNDGIDNDGDLRIDDQDGGCGSPQDPTEEFDCMDGVDGDGDGFTDYPDDLSCRNPIQGSETNGECEDGIDNDWDGLVDYPDDPGCPTVADAYEDAEGGNVADCTIYPALHDIPGCHLAYLPNYLVGSIIASIDLVTRDALWAVDSALDLADANRP